MTSNKSDEFVRIKDRIPYHGKGVDELTAALRRILSEPVNKFTQKIVLEVGAPHIYIEKLVPKDQATDIPQLSLHDIIRTAEMEEYELEDGKSSAQHLWGMLEMVHDKGLHGVAVVAGNKSKFQKWLGIRINNVKPMVFGIPFQMLGELPEDVFVVCGAQNRIADIEDIKYSVKVTI